MSLVLGVDPGATGGIALLDRSGVIRFAEAMPALRTAIPTIDVGALNSWLTHHHEPVRGYVERAQAMPRQGVSSSFNYGAIAASVCTALTALGVGYELVQAAKWKRDMGLDSDKRRSLDLVRQMYPRLHLRAKDDGIAEAILLARWGLRQLGGAA